MWSATPAIAAGCSAWIMRARMPPRSVTDLGLHLSWSLRHSGIHVHLIPVTHEGTNHAHRFHPVNSGRQAHRVGAVTEVPKGHCAVSAARGESMAVWTEGHHGRT